MGVYFYGGRIVFGGGHVSFCEDSCALCPADYEHCEGCICPTLGPLSLDIDASLATGNPGAVITGCDDADCQALTGVYVVDPAAAGCATFTPCVAVTDMGFECGPGTIAPNCVELDGDTLCYWVLPINEESPTLPCVSNNYGDVIWVWFSVVLARATGGGNYCLWVSITPVDQPDEWGVGQGVYWLKDLGPTAPNCSTMWPVELGPTEWCYPGYYFPGLEAEDITHTCYLHDITITVDLA